METGSESDVEEGLDPATPWGYHHLEQLDGPAHVDLIVSPGHCYWPADTRQWGWAVQLYALRSESYWGIGDLVDLAQLCRWSDLVGAGVVMTNPLHATRTAPHFETSPYFPSSRCFLNPIYLRPEAIVSGVVRENGALGASELVDYDVVWGRKKAALEKIWAIPSVRDSLDQRLAKRSDASLLKAFATFAALSEVYLGPWSSWPSGLRQPGSAGVAEFARAHRERIGFHSFLQVALDDQMARAASAGIGLAHDLAVGVAPDGFDAWMWQHAMVAGASVGAPPDAFNPAGQDWGLAAFDPAGLRRDRYRPVIAALRAAFRHSAGLRIDHVMGLFRLFMIPDGSDPALGSYMQAYSSEMLDIVALESWRARSWVVGEDLGTVGPGVREELARRRLASYKVAFFEDDPPSTYPPVSLACASTHDLPTVAGLWSGTDLADQVRAGLAPNAGAAGEMKARVGRNFAGTTGSSGAEAVALALAEGLGGSPAGLALASLEDALGVLQRHNMPGTLASWPNWRLVLPEGLDSIAVNPKVLAIAEAIDAARRQPVAGRP